MRIERLTDNRIKVTLTAADLTNLDISINQLTPNSKELHTFLFHIMETVREETGFNPYSGQVVVEATPSGGGISILISKLNCEKERITREQFRKISSIKPKIKNKAIALDTYYFDSFDDLCGALLRMEDGAVQNGKLYRFESEYCLILKNGKNFRQSSYALSEYSKKRAVNVLNAEHIMEHWTLIAAGERLRTMVDGIVKLYAE